jgi:hypothetical protein
MHQLYNADSVGGTKMRLNGWLWAGIVLSVLWALGAAISTHNANVESAQSFANFAYKTCSANKEIAHDTDLSSCEQERTKNLATWTQGDAGNVAFTALAPIPLGWLAGFILLYICRAQIIGFRAVLKWKTLTWPKKAFVWFCAAAALTAVLLAVTVVSNLYVDTQVPVSLSPFLDVIKTGDEFVTVQGTWTRSSGLNQSSSLAFPLQTSRIECYRSQRRCTEARASVSDNLLTSDLVEYDVDSWTAASIVLRNDAPCASEMYTIDLITKAVSGAGHLTNRQDPFCKRFAGSEDDWTYRLTSGFDVYWRERQKARPLPLRLIQTLFGN